MAISALAVIDAGSVTEGKINTNHVQTLPAPSKANSAVRDRLKTDYAVLPDWASGLKVFEIPPVSPETGWPHWARSRTSPTG
ncbi:MAG TPA: hypothetical protein PLE12_03060 [Propionicimonas sp.]|nr:hypothetical protein [Propionicimonas sp.]